MQTHMSDNDLMDLKQRCYRAMLQGFVMGRADHYVAMLSGEIGGDVLPSGTSPMSPEHIIALIDRVQAVRKGDAPKVSLLRNPEVIKAPALLRQVMPEPVQAEPEPVPEPVMVEEAPVEVRVEVKADKPRSGGKKGSHKLQ